MGFVGVPKSISLVGLLHVSDIPDYVDMEDLHEGENMTLNLIKIEPESKKVFFKIQSTIPTHVAGTRSTNAEAMAATNPRRVLGKAEQQAPSCRIGNY